MMSAVSNLVERRARVVAQAFREYMKAKSEFLTAAEICSVRGWPDRKLSVVNAFRLQMLFSQREELRLEYLLVCRTHEISEFNSVSEFSTRITEHWSDEDESSIAGTGSIYSDISLEIEGLQGNLDSDALTGPFIDAQRDPEYARARRALQEKLQSLDDQLSDLVP